MSTYANFRTDEDAEKNGITLNLGTSGSFVVRRASGHASAYHKRLSTLLQPHQRALAAGTADQKTVNDLSMQAFIETSLISWDGVTDEKNQPWPFSKEAAKKLFTDLPDLFESVSANSANFKNFLAARLEDSAKN